MKIVIYQILAALLIFFYTYLWYGDAKKSLAYTASLVLILSIFQVFFEYVWIKELHTYFEPAEIAE